MDNSWQLMQLAITMTIVGTTGTELGNHSNKQYWLESDFTGVTWSEAFEQCVLRHRGQLAILDTTEEIQYIERELQSLDLGPSRAWLGAKRDYSNEQRHWLDGTAITGIIKESDRNKCLTLDSEGVYEPVVCRGKHAYMYMCEYSSNTDCSDSGTCRVFYQTSGNPISWYDAREICLSSGGDLALIQNYNDFMDIISRIDKTIGRDAVYVGGYRLPLQWMKTAETSLADVIYFNDWLGNTYFDEGACLTTTSEEWLTTQCNRSHIYFICQKYEDQTNKNEGLRSNVGFVAGMVVMSILVAIALILVTFFLITQRTHDRKRATRNMTPTQIEPPRRTEEHTEKNNVQHRPDSTPIHQHTAKNMANMQATPQIQSSQTPIYLELDADYEDVGNFEVSSANLSPVQPAIRSGYTNPAYDSTDMYEKVDSVATYECPYTGRTMSPAEYEDLKK